MKHRVFGRSGIKVSEIIFGAGSVGGILIHQDDATKREAISSVFTRLDRAICRTCSARIFNECTALPLPEK